MAYVFLVIAILWFFRTMLAPNEQRAREPIAASRLTGWNTGRVQGLMGPSMRSFSGRAGRAEWWVQVAWSWVIGSLLFQVPVIGPVLTLPWLMAVLAVTVRRFHDLGKTGWMVAPLALAIAIVVGLFANAHSLHLDLSVAKFDFAEEPMTAAARLALICSVIVLVGFAGWMGMLDGDFKSNRFGEA